MPPLKLLLFTPKVWNLETDNWRRWKKKWKWKKDKCDQKQKIVIEEHTKIPPKIKIKQNNFWHLMNKDMLYLSVEVFQCQHLFQCHNFPPIQVFRCQCFLFQFRFCYYCQSFRCQNKTKSQFWPRRYVLSKSDIKVFSTFIIVAFSPPVGLKCLYLSAESAQHWVNPQRKCCQMLVWFYSGWTSRLCFGVCGGDRYAVRAPALMQVSIAYRQLQQYSLCKLQRRPLFSSLTCSTTATCLCCNPDLCQLLTVTGGSVFVHFIVLS